MGDSTPMLVLSILQLWHITGDQRFLVSFEGPVKRAVAWQVEQSAAFGLPINLWSCPSAISP